MLPCVEPYVRIRSGESHRDPCLLLPREILAPWKAGADIFGDVVFQGPVMDADDLGLVGADLFEHFSQGGCPDILAVVDAALRHLPRAGTVEPFADEHMTIPVKDAKPDTGAVRQGRHQGTIADNGAIWIPRSDAPLAQSCTLFITAG